MSKHRNIAAGSRVHIIKNMSVRVCVVVSLCAGVLIAVPSITARADSVTTSISVGSDPQGVAINPAGTFAYVTNSNSGSVSKIDLATDSVVATISIGGWTDPTYTQPKGVVFNPAGTYAYVTHVDMISGLVSKIDTATDTIVATIVNTRFHWGLAINPAGTFAYVANWSSANTVSKINLATDTVAATIRVGECPNEVVINPAGTFAYVTNQCGAGSVSKINLSTESVTTVAVGADYKNPRGLAINPAGTFAYLAKYSTPGSVSKIALTSTETQSISFTKIGKSVVPAPLTQLFGTKSVTVSASASSGLSVSFASSTESVCTVSGTTVTFVSTGDCTINADQSGGQGWDAATQVQRTFTILPSPPSGEVGVSINSGDSYTNSKSVLLNLIWPEYATEARVSNDGGFASAKTSVLKLAPSVKWELDDSVKGVYTKVVYVRFSGIGDTAKSYTDDIILDTTAPVVESSTATGASGAIEVTLKATDDITGVDKVQIKNGTTTVTREYSTEISVSENEIGLTVSSAGVRKMATTSIDISVSDKAGNWSTFKTLSVAGTLTTTTATTPTTTSTSTSTTATTPTSTTGTTSTVTTHSGAMPKVATSKSTTAKLIAAYAKIIISSTSKVSLKVVSAYAKYCKVSGTTLKGLKAGSCKVTVTVTPKKGRATSKTVTLKVTK
jgi:YVTN family beta-propeller protein